MGEAKRRKLVAQAEVLRAMAVDTPGGRIQVKWDHAASATPNTDKGAVASIRKWLEQHGVEP